MSEDYGGDSERSAQGDVEYCSSCGEPLPSTATSFTDDLVLDRYRTEFRCPACGYHGEVFRHGV